MPDTTASTQLDAESIRRQFPVLNQQLEKGRRPIYLDSAASAQKPAVVIAKEREVEEQYFANAHRGRYSFGARIDNELEASRKKIAAFTGAYSKDQVAFTAGTTLGLNQVAFGWGRGRLQPGDEIVISVMEHHANFVPWQQLARQTGATLKLIPLTPDGRLDDAEFDTVIGTNTRIVAVCGMSNVLGTVNPVAELSRRAHAMGAILVVDGAQSIPHCRTNVTEDDVDFLVFSGHKLYGPTGVGVIVGRPDRMEELEPIVFGGHMISRVTVEKSEWAPPPDRLEAGTLPIVQAIALGTAIDWMNEIGVNAIHTNETALLAEATRRLKQIPGMTIYGPDIQYKGAIVSFRIDNLHPEDLATMLDRRAVFTRHGHHCTMPLHETLGVTATTRVSFAAYNTISDVDALIEAIEFAREKLRRK